MRVPKYRYTVYYRETPSSPQWDDTFESGTSEENKAAAELRAYQLSLDGALTVVVPSIIPVPTVVSFGDSDHE